MRHLGRHLDRLRACFARMPDPRRGSNRRYAMADVGMAALSVFLMQSPSFLAHQRALAEGRARSNAHTLFGLDRVPCDNHVRQMLDGVPAAHFDEQFHGLVEDLDAHGALAPMRRLGGHVLVALDGTEFFRSRSIHCGNCSTRRRSDGGTEHYHQMLAANLVAPGQGLTLPLPPEFVTPRDGTDKQDCERQAAKRWLQQHGSRCAGLRPVYLGDDLYACQPVCQAMLDAGGDFLLTAKPGSHKTLYEYLDGIRLPTLRRTAGPRREAPHPPLPLDDRTARARRRRRPARQLAGGRQRPGPTAPSPTAAPSSPASTSTAATSPNSPTAPRARWKIENETFNVLKQHGYHLEHNFGHGKDTLAAVLVVLNLLAFGLHAACELAEDLWRQARERLGTRRRLFEHLRTVTEYQVFPSWTALMDLLATGGTAAQPP